MVAYVGPLLPAILPHWDVLGLQAPKSFGAKKEQTVTKLVPNNRIVYP